MLLSGVSLVSLCGLIVWQQPATKPAVTVYVKEGCRPVIIIAEINPSVFECNVPVETRHITAKPCFVFLTHRLLFPQSQRFWLTLPVLNSKHVIKEVNSRWLSKLYFPQRNTFSKKQCKSNSWSSWLRTLSVLYPERVPHCVYLLKIKTSTHWWVTHRKWECKTVKSIPMY